MSAGGAPPGGSAGPAAAPDSSLRPLLWTVFLPAAVYGVGQGAAAPVIALTARDLGASVGLAGLSVAAVGLGLLLGDLPAGRIVARFGERIAIVGGTAAGTIGVLACLFAPNVAVLLTGVVLTGLANAVWGLARQGYLAEAVPYARRARAMAGLTGMMRLGFFVGPFLGAATILLVGVRGGFVVQLVAVGVAGVLMARLPDPPRQPPAGPAPTVTRVALRHRRLLGTLGAGSLLMGAARASREAVLPLWADHLGLDAATASIVFGIGAAIDLACSYPAGQLMDRFGRSIVAVPSLLVMALSYALVPLAVGPASLTAVAVVMGVGNGLGNGVIMTLGADVAPAGTRAEFLGAWRLTHDAGMFVGPLLVGLVAAAGSLVAAVAALGAVSALGAAVLGRTIPVHAPAPARPAPADQPTAPTQTGRSA
ncbi:MFS transporter [Pseudonocardia sp. NPDC046786]|uniref:MFS transporter n=1 Tax=Pseudonocardia sp. NPDC046786 TaxID=3155471 RepID=UPI0033F4EFB9